MASLNKKKDPIFTHENCIAKHISPEQQLRRSVMCCMLWENEFYENGIDIIGRIIGLISVVKPDDVARIAIDARDKSKLRHIPLLIVREMARLSTHKHLVSSVLSHVIQRPDELTEFLAIYWRDGRQPLSAQVKKGLAYAFNKFDSYQLSKYNRDNQIKLKDVLFLCHAKPKNREQEIVWKKLIDGSLESPDTWEVALSSGGDKKAHWERLLIENKLGGMALLRNLRNFKKENVDEKLVINSILNIKSKKILPFRFIAAAKHAQQWETHIEKIMLRGLRSYEMLAGKTALLVDVSGSMISMLSSKSELNRLDAASGVAILLREICDDIDIFSFSILLKGIPPRHGFALSDAINNSQPHGGTYLGSALNELYRHKKYDRIIVITDEQARYEAIPEPGKDCKGYMINIASCKNGIGYYQWIHIDGWSESVVDFIIEYEKEFS